MRPFPILSLLAAALIFPGTTLTVPAAVLPPETVRVLPLDPQNPPNQMLDRWLKDRAMAALAIRRAKYETLKTLDDVRTWQSERRVFFERQLGGWPARTPLNARTTGQLDFSDYRIEKVIFESRPRFYVSATLYLPKGKGPFPGILHPTGHSSEAKGRDLYQQASIVMAKAGLAVLCFDPIGQGERRFFRDAQGKPLYRGTTQEHMVLGQGFTLLGSSLARTMIWDGMRAIDYLQTRPDIDPNKIGCTGISGGGTQTSFLMALDDRIGAAAPGCYLTGYERLLNTIGPQDHEQNIPGQIAFGMDHADYILMRAPKPTLIMAATQDYFAIEGAWDLFRQGKRVYGRLGFPERVDLVEPDTKHGFPTEMRVAAARWMLRWLSGRAVEVTEPEFPVLTSEELHATPTGSVFDLPGARSTFDLNREWQEELAQQRTALQAKLDEDGLRERIRRHLEVAPLKSLKASLKLQVVDTRRIGNRQVTRMRLQVEPGMVLPLVRIEPDLPKGDPLLVLSDEGKAAVLEKEWFESALEAGRTIWLADLRGLGETSAEVRRGSYDDIAGHDWRESSMALLLGESWVSLRTRDVMACLTVLEPIHGAGRVHLLAAGEAGVPALHAAALEPGLWNRLELRDTLEAWAPTVGNIRARRLPPVSVYGALRLYDLPDLRRLAGKDRVTIKNGRAAPLEADR